MDDNPPGESSEEGAEVRSTPQPQAAPGSISSLKANLSFWLPAVFVLLFAAGGYEVLKYSVVKLIFNPYAQTEMPPEAEEMFLSFDQDLDGVIDMAEFGELYRRLSSGEGRSDFEPFTPLDVAPEFNPKNEHLILKAEFQPLNMSTMTKEPSEHIDVALEGLRSWQVVEQKAALFSANEFLALLPADGAMDVGKVYTLLSPSLMAGPPSNSRRYPPEPNSPIKKLFYRMMQMFHPRPFVVPRFEPQGCHAMIRALSDQHLELVFRLHAEFQLNKPPQFAFWFTPGQFFGRVIMERDSPHVEYVHIYVPTANSLNVDMEWFTGPGSANMEVDIGFMPQMELRSHSPSFIVEMSTEATDPDETDRLVAPKRENEDKNVTDEVNLQLPDPYPLLETVAESRGKVDIFWYDKVSVEEARSKLEKKFFPFKEVPYYPLVESFKRAEEQQKLVHHILLWGALDDQSC